MIRSITIGGVLLIGIFLCCLVASILIMVISLTCDCWWTLGSLFNLNTRECKRNFRHYFNNSDMDSDEPTLLLVQMKKPLKRHRNGSVFVNKLVLNENLEELTVLV
uniref:Candidate secreted effector n=1 Tax=Meloidogyne incognita TaxID=6306 RepID=A0A914MEV4_MELIC